jgi:exopolyphosphatase/guanosine-5'-triphosphate,3'-diphosphate pyrophosphatase
MKKINGLPDKKKKKKYSVRPDKYRKEGANTPLMQNNYAAIDLGTNSCRLVVATPTTTSFRVVETFSKVVRLGEGIIQDNELSPRAMKRTVQALKVCRGVIDEYMPITASRFVATAACRRAKNVAQFVEMVKRDAGIELEVISSKEEARLSVVGCLPLLNRNIKRVLVFDIGGGSSQISLARVTDGGKTFIEGFVSLPYGVVTVSEAFAGHEMSKLEYSTVLERTQSILAEFEEKYHIREAIANQEIQVIGTSGTVTVIGAVHLRLPRYNRSAVDGIAISAPDIEATISRIKKMGTEGRCKHPCIGQSKSDLTVAGCAIIEGLTTFWPISEITVADRGIREGILLDLMHQQKNTQPVKKYNNKKRRRFPFDRRKKTERTGRDGEQHRE